MVVEERVFSGRYRVVALLGEGGMARVYKAVDERLRRVVAIKTLHAVFNHEPQLFARFEREARLAAGLSHPNIINIYDIGTDVSGAHYIVMEYVQGETLKHLIGHDAPLTPEECLPMLRQLCLALDYAHERGVIHRDVKPENIFLTATRHVKVGDFGIARALDSTGITTTGMVMGSASYLSPEQAQGQPATAQSDLYASGVVLFEMLTRRLPFSATTPLAMAMKHVEEMPPSPSSVNPLLPRGLDAVVLKALAKDPEARYRTGSEFIAALEREIDRPFRAVAIAAPSVTPRAGSHAAHSIGELAVQRRDARAATPLRTGASPVVTGPAQPSRRRRALIPLAVAAVAIGTGGVVAATHGGTQTATGRPQHGAPQRHVAPRHTPVSARLATPAGATPSAGIYSAVSAARRKHLARHAMPVATVARRRVSAPSLHATLAIARGERTAGTAYVASGATTHFTTAAPLAYAVARWQAGGKTHQFEFRWATPGGHGDSYGGYNRSGSAYAEIPLAASGTYRVTLYIDNRRIAQRTFTVVPSNATLSAGATPSGSVASNPPASGPTAVPTVALPPAPTATAPAPPSASTRGAPVGQIEQAVMYANDVYMQVMNRRDASGVGSAFGAELAEANRAVAAGLAARHEHYAIRLLGMSFGGVTRLGPTTARVAVTKTESAPLYSDTGALLRAGGAYTVSLVDIVQQIDGRWVVTQVYH